MAVVEAAVAKVNEDSTETVVDELVNPIAMAYNNAHGFFIIEGSPANRVVSYSLKTGNKTIVAETGPNPYAIVMSPL
jgi:hypothetical protein